MIVAPGMFATVVMCVAVLGLACFLIGRTKEKGWEFFIGAGAFILFGLVVFSIALYGGIARDNGFGNPQTSLEPGVYEIYGKRLGNEVLYLLAAEVRPQSTTEPNFVKLAYKDVERSPTQPGTFMVVRVTRCFTVTDCLTKLDFVFVGE
ncbi:MAG: hypothetical protein A2806_02200 [Candidatus Terrybacteria bacterium RIFCSPHIGHO2_01_FULL_48_17]|uniref:Uncharacterized protein n=1 Tax=Candidatus Terrybacteria bacterium RIFCSPHIGHO2_01_FULL_48_17 TaxID=1802362 RepID=A0A1G2PHK7_9BACT|nr:MAG: hypothetical protein A2806_02200 [Candidatus Terrybacteria bacterium RIFCSPHIGHO2_01_FULL_48_17]OHA53561.1 MAG: hypothetical protein A3A30_00155 [Candidatus Terrybacteria bacterium RIFCSPLOWO2_01_FULL_48_14]